MRNPLPHLQNTLFTLSLGFAALAMATQNAFGQTPPPAAPNAQCAPRAQVLQALSDAYGEGRRAIGVAGQTNVMELFVNSETGTWTITGTRPDGMMCLIASGSHFETVSEPAPAKGTPT